MGNILFAHMYLPSLKFRYCEKATEFEKKQSPTFFEIYLVTSKRKVGDFFKFLQPSHNIWTLIESLQENTLGIKPPLLVYPIFFNLISWKKSQTFYWSNSSVFTRFGPSLFSFPTFKLKKSPGKKLGKTRLVVWCPKNISSCEFSLPRQIIAIFSRQRLMIPVAA